MRGNRPFLRLTLVALFSCLASDSNASTYIEAETLIGSFSKADTYFQQPAASSASGAFIGSLGIYTPITNERRFGHLDLGLQSRFSNASISGTSSPLAMGTLNLEVRLEIWRFFAGIGYSPVTWVSTPQQGITSLHLNPGTSSYLGEFGAIWRVIPEFQITATLGFEYGKGPNGTSPNPVTAYGLAFRFPINPKESSGNASGVGFDGFRYPFGVMR